MGEPAESSVPHAAAHKSAQVQWRPTIAARLPVSSGRNGRCSFRRSMPIPASRSCSTATAASTWWMLSLPALPTTSVFLRTASATGDTLTGGYRRSENAYLAAGYVRVLVLSPFPDVTL